jgi:hypothetical protein
MDFLKVIYPFCTSLRVGLQAAAGGMWNEIYSKTICCNMHNMHNMHSNVQVMSYFAYGCYYGNMHNMQMQHMDVALLCHILFLHICVYYFAHSAHSLHSICIICKIWMFQPLFHILHIVHIITTLHIADAQGTFILNTMLQASVQPVMVCSS